MSNITLGIDKGCPWFTRAPSERASSQVISVIQTQQRGAQRREQSTWWRMRRIHKGGAS